MDKVKQSSVNPTNKLTAATVTVAVMEVARIIMINTVPQFYDPALWAALNPVMVFAVGWLVKDRFNGMIVVE